MKSPVLEKIRQNAKQKFWNNVVSYGCAITMAVMVYAFLASHFGGK